MFNLEWFQLILFIVVKESIFVEDSNPLKVSVINYCGFDKDWWWVTRTTFEKTHFWQTHGSQQASNRVEAGYFALAGVTTRQHSIIIFDVHCLYEDIRCCTSWENNMLWDCQTMANLSAISEGNRTQHVFGLPDLEGCHSQCYWRVLSGFIFLLFVVVFSILFVHMVNHLSKKHTFHQGLWHPRQEVQRTAAPLFIPVARQRGLLVSERP